jgi:hypothetical protein
MNKRAACFAMVRNETLTNTGYMAFLREPDELLAVALLQQGAKP